jgi:hypothetical protein
MWEKKGKAGDQRIYGPDFQKELAGAQSFEQPFDPFDPSTGSGQSRQAVRVYGHIFHFSFWLSFHL